MAAHSKAPDVLRELFAALDDDPRKAAECLARPLLADRLIRSYYSHDRRLHGELKARAERELAANGSPRPRKGGGAYAEVEWRRGPSRTPGVIGLEPETFDARVREVRRALGGASGEIEIGRLSPLREDDSRFYALSVLALDDQRLRVATVEWRKRPFDSWWSRDAPAAAAPGHEHVLRLPSRRVLQARDCRDDSWKPTLQLLDPRYWHTAVWTGSEMIVFGGMSYVGTSTGTAAATTRPPTPGPSWPRAGRPGGASRTWRSGPARRWWSGAAGPTPAAAATTRSPTPGDPPPPPMLPPRAGTPASSGPARRCSSGEATGAGSP